MKSLFVFALAIVALLSGCSNTTTPNSPTHLSFSYYETIQADTNQLVWNSSGTEIHALPQADSALIGGWMNLSGGQANEEFTLGFHGVHESGTYYFGRNDSISISGAYTNSFGTYTMLPGGTITLTAFHNDTVVNTSDFRGTFSGKMITSIGSVVDTMVVSNGVFQVPD